MDLSTDPVDWPNPYVKAVRAGAGDMSAAGNATGNDPVSARSEDGYPPKMRSVHRSAHQRPEAPAEQGSAFESAGSAREG